jgi:hypothetical protein
MYANFIPLGQIAGPVNPIINDEVPSLVGFRFHERDVLTPARHCLVANVYFRFPFRK